MCKTAKPFDAKKRDPPKSGSDRDSNSSASGGSGGIVQSMKAAIQHTVGSSARAEPVVGVKKAVKDGSAHPHAGSDAQVNIQKLIAKFGKLI